MKRLRLWGAWFTAAGLLIGLLAWPHEGAAGPRLVSLDPEVSGDPDTPGGRQEPNAGADVGSLPIVQIRVVLPTGNAMMLDVKGVSRLLLQRHSLNEHRARAIIRPR